MSVMETLILTTALAGVGGTGLGGVIGAMLQKDSKRTVSLLLSFAAGVMLSVVCFDLVTEAIETQVGIVFVVGAIAFGVAVTYFLNYLIDRKTNPEVPHIDGNHPKTADDLDELIHSNHLEQHYARKDSKLGLFVAGIVMASAIALHNVPEGMTIGASYASNNGAMGIAAAAGIFHGFRLFCRRYQIHTGRFFAAYVFWSADNAGCQHRADQLQPGALH